MRGRIRAASGAPSAGAAVASPSPPVSKRLSAIADKYETLRSMAAVPMEKGTAQAAPAGLEASAVELLRSLIREDTVNPPGNERALQERLAAELTEAGFECELLAAEPERPNLLARLRGGDGPTLAYLGHVDTVRADPGSGAETPGPATSRTAGSGAAARST